MLYSGLQISFLVWIGPQNRLQDWQGLLFGAKSDRAAHQAPWPDRATDLALYIAELLARLSAQMLLGSFQVLWPGFLVRWGWGVTQ